MRLIDADKMLEDMENGKAPLVGYVPRDWILDQPTVRPEDMKFISRDQIRSLVQDLIDMNYKALRKEYPSGKATLVIKSVTEFKSFHTLVKLSDSLFVDPVPLRDCLLELRWVGGKSQDTNEWLIDHPSFRKLVDIAFPEWDKENRARAITHPDCEVV